MGHSSDNPRENLYKLAGRQRNERKTLGKLGSFKTQTLENEAFDEESYDNTQGFIKKFMILGLILFLITLGIFLATKIYGARLSTGEHTDSIELFSIIIDEDKLSIPANAVRFSSDRRSGFHNKIELYRHWPSLSGFSKQLRNEFESQNNSDNLIFMTLEKRNMMLDMSGRIKQIYENYFEGNGKLLPSGLMRQGLSAEGGYIDEDLYYAVDSPYPFATRCIKDNEATIRPFCIRDVQIGKSMMLTYRFHKKLLPQWIDLDQAIRAHVKSMITNM